MKHANKIIACVAGVVLLGMLSKLSCHAQQTQTQINWVTNPAPAGPVLLNESTGVRTQPWVTQIVEVVTTSILRGETRAILELPRAGAPAASPVRGTPTSRSAAVPRPPPLPIATNAANAAAGGTLQPTAEQRRAARDARRAAALRGRPPPTERPADERLSVKEGAPASLPAAAPPATNAPHAAPGGTLPAPKRGPSASLTPSAIRPDKKPMNAYDLIRQMLSGAAESIRAALQDEPTCREYLYDAGQMLHGVVVPGGVPSGQYDPESIERVLTTLDARTHYDGRGREALVAALTVYNSLLACIEKVEMDERDFEQKLAFALCNGFLQGLAPV